MKLVIQIACLLASCDRSSPDPTPAPSPRNDGVQLVSLGQEPRRVLQYHLRKGSHAALEMAMDMDLDAGRVMKLPTIRMTLDLAVEDVLADGSATVKSQVTGTTLTDRPGATMDAASLAPMSQAITGLGYAFTLAPDGSVTGGKVTGSAPSGMQAQLGDMTRAIEQVAMRLPPVPVGVGARWSANKTVTQNGIRLTTVTTTELTLLEGDRLGFTSQTTLSAPDQQTVQQGTTMDLKDIGGGGSGSGTIDLATMGMRGALTSEFRGTVLAGGQTSTMHVVMGLTLR